MNKLAVSQNNLPNTLEDLSKFVLVRKQEKIIEKEKCYICGNHKLITEEHYIVPISEVKKANLISYEDEVIDLCPNCHTYLHLILNEKFEKYSEIFEYCKTQQMRENLIKIYSRYYYLKAKNRRNQNANR